MVLSRHFPCLGCVGPENDWYHANFQPTRTSPVWMSIPQTEWYLQSWKGISTCENFISGAVGYRSSVTDVPTCGSSTPDGMSNSPVDNGDTRALVDIDGVEEEGDGFEVARACFRALEARRDLARVRERWDLAIVGPSIVQTGSIDEVEVRLSRVC